MKKFLTVLILALFGLGILNAETIAFRANAFCAKEYTYRGWTDWSNWQRCSIPITIDTTNDMIVILSERTQYYRIVDYTGTYRQNRAQIIEYKFVDQDGDRGTMLLVQKDTGQSEIYVHFANVAWGYDVSRL